MEESKNIVESEWKKFFEKLKIIIDSRPSLSVNAILDIIAIEFNLKALKKNIENYKREFDLNKKYPKKLVVGDSNFSISNIIEFLDQKYPDNLSRIITNEIGFLYYIYYYEGTEGKVKPAIIKIKLNESKEEWDSGEIFYFRIKNGRLLLSSVFDLERVSPRNGNTINPEYFYFKGISEYPDHRHQVNFFTINLQGKPLTKRFLCFLSSNTLSYKINLGDVPSVNFGIIKKVEYKNLEQEFNAPIHPWIVNALIKKKLTFDLIENSIFTDQQKFISETNSNESDVTVNFQYRCSEIMKGVYIGFYFRNEIRNLQNTEQGGIAVVIFIIENDGKANIHFVKSTKEKVIYKGHLQFLNNSSKKIKGNFEIKNNNLYRFSLYLNEIDNDSTVLGGAFSGFKDDKPFATPILLLRLVDNNNSIEELIQQYKPRRISKFNFDEYISTITKFDKTISKDAILSYLKIINEQFIENMNKCTSSNQNIVKSDD